MKTYPIGLIVEEIALGSVLRKLHKIPGIARIDFIMGHGGNGAGRQRLEKVAKVANAARKAKQAKQAKPAKKAKRIKRTEKGVGPAKMLSILSGGPIPVPNAVAVLGDIGITPKAVHGLFYRMKEDGLVVRKDDRFELTAKGLKAAEGAQHG